MQEIRQPEVGLEESQRITAVIAAASLALGSSLDLKAVLDELLRCLSDLVPFDSANVMLLEGESELVVFAHRGYEHWTDVKLLESVAFSATQNATFLEICRTGRSLLISDTRTFPGWERPPGTEHVNSWMGVPLLIGDKLLGIYSVDKNTPGFFSERHVRLVESLAAHAALAINNAKNYEALERQATALQGEVAQRERAERELVERETLLRSIIDHEPDCVKLLDQQGRLLSMNPAGLAMIEADSLEQVQGQSVSALLLPAYRSDFQRLTAAVFRGESGKLEFELKGLKGTQRWLETHALPLRDSTGRITSLLGITRDITEQKRGEAEIREAAEYSRQIIASAREGIVVYDRELRFTVWNPYLEEATGLRPDQVLGKHPWEVVPVLEQHGFVVEKDILLRALAGESVFTSDREFINRVTGKAGWFSSKHAPLRDVQGNIQGVIVTIHGITKRKLSEEALLASHQQLRELTQELQRQREQEQARIAREIHDDLGQLLTGVRLDVASLKKLLGTTTPKVKERLAALDEISTEAIRSMRRIAMELRPIVLDDLGLVAAVEWHLEEFQKRAQVKVKARLLETEPELSPDKKTALFRILQESLTNVTRHANATLVEISLQSTASDDGGILELQVTDDGRGFTPETKEAGHLGLRGMRERMVLVKGDLAVASSADGTTITATVSLDKKGDLCVSV